MAMQKNDGGGTDHRSPLIAKGPSTTTDLSATGLKVTENDLAARPSPGRMLRAARERGGLSRAEIAESLNLLQSQLAAIEEDGFDRLPGDTFTIGYLRNYARAVGIAPDRVVEAFFAIRPQSRPAQVRVSGAVGDGPRKRLTLDTPAGARRHYWGLAAVGLVVAALWGLQQMSPSPEVLPLTADVGGVDLPLPGGLDVALHTGGNDPLATVELVPRPELGPALPAVAAFQEDSAGAVVSASEPASAEDRLSLRFVADCWVEVRDRDNRVLVAVLKRADDRLTVEGRGPFKVLLGFAEGVEMAFNGEPVEIGTSSGSRSARLIVGNS